MGLFTIIRLCSLHHRRAFMVRALHPARQVSSDKVTSTLNAIPTIRETVLRLFQEAQSCYEDAKLLEHARRAAELAADLIERINTDYASSRLVLENALSSEKWVGALNEIHLLLRLTEHVSDHAYVDYLSSIVGKVTIRANAAP
jgi:predicted component of type VI protein secretion system